MTSLLPALAVARVTQVQGIAPVLVASRRSRSLHLQVLDVRRGRDFASTYAASFTDRGVLRRGQRPLCGQRSLRWHASSIDGRPLCRRCSRAAAGLAPVVDGRLVARLVPLEQVLATIEHARTETELSAAQILATTAGYLGRQVPGPDGPVLLTRLIGQARARLAAASPLSPRDHAWAARIRPVSRFPRRVR